MKTCTITGFGENTDPLSVPAIAEFYAQQEPKLWVGVDLLGFFALDEEDLETLQDPDDSPHTRIM